MVLSLLIGNYGAGKTACLTALLRLAYGSLGQEVYSNYHLEFPHWRIESISDLDKIKRGVFGGDEIWYSIDSRNFKTPINQVVSYIVSKCRKREVDWLLTAQDMGLIDNRLRDRIHNILVPEIYYSNGSRIESYFGEPPVFAIVHNYVRNELGEFELTCTFMLDLQEAVHLYDTNEELDPLPM